MATNTRKMTRRMVLTGAATTTALWVVPVIGQAQDGPVRMATLTPLTGAGGSYGPRMRDSVVAVVEEVNKAGGVLGRKIDLSSEDSQTNPEAAVRAARKLIDVDRVIAVMGTWASSVTTAVAPLCWESKTMIACVSGADSITLLPHQGYLIRTQPNSKLQIRTVTTFMLEEGAQRLAWIGPQTPFAQSSIDIMTELAKDRGKTMDSVIYEADKTTYRSEVDKILRSKPDFLMLGGYTPDVIVLLRDLYRAGYDGRIMGPAYAVSAKLLEALPPEVTEGIYTFAPSPAVDSNAYQRVQKIHGIQDVDPYSSQTYDHANLMILGLAAAGQASGTAIRDTLRQISQGGGDSVDNAVEGLRLLAAGKKIDYTGASGPCDFTDIGDITGTKFRYERVKKGAFEMLRII